MTRQQLLSIGLDDDGIGYRLKRGRLHRVHRGVYAVGHAPLRPVDRAAAAVLACGVRAALSHGSAMTLWGFWKRWDEPFHVTVASDRKPEGIRIHRSRALLRRDVTAVDGIRVTSAARTLLDMAPRLPQKSLRRIINDARRAHILTLDALADVAQRSPSHPGAPLLKAEAANPHNPTRSTGEDDFPGFCERYGLPIPQMNVVLHGYEVDAYFQAEKLVVELDGWPYHNDRNSFEADRERDATMLMHGVATIRITYDRYEGEPDREGARLQKILRDRRSA